MPAVTPWKHSTRDGTPHLYVEQWLREPPYGAFRTRAAVMPAPKFVAQVQNVYFLARIGSTLRWATSDITHEELSPDIKRLLRRLDRMEARQKVPQGGDNGPEPA
jgi:hypothetical protein